MPSLVIGVIRESAPGEARVSLVPAQVPVLLAAGMEVMVESGAGAAAFLPDGAYAAAGAQVVSGPTLVARADVLTMVGRPPKDVAAALRPGQVVVGMLAPLAEPGYARRLAERAVTVVSLDCLPRTLTRAQSMDALTSQANVAGYKAALVAANTFGRFFPMLVTAAGTTRPARVLVLGAGIAGLQAIGTARRLGAVVSAYDVRPEARAEVESVGGTFLDLDTVIDGSSTGGYARVLGAAEEDRQRQALAAQLGRYDIIITTAQVPGRRPPVLVGQEDLKSLAPGSVVVDLAAGPDGGNVAGSRPGETVVTDEGVVVIGAGNLAGAMPAAASAAYSRNVTALLRYLIHDGAVGYDPTDEIAAGVVVTHGGVVVHPAVTRLVESGGGLS